MSEIANLEFDRVLQYCTFVHYVVLTYNTNPLWVCNHEIYINLLLPHAKTLVEMMYEHVIKKKLAHDRCLVIWFNSGFWQYVTKYEDKLNCTANVTLTELYYFQWLYSLVWYLTVFSLGKPILRYADAHMFSVKGEMSTWHQLDFLQVSRFALKVPCILYSSW